VKSVAKKIRKNGMTAVVDPVMVSTSGHDLADKGFVEAVKKELIPETYVLTPNIQEAEILTGRKVANLNDVKKVCKDLYELGAKHVLITGGHLKGEKSQDVFFDGENYRIFTLPRIPDKRAHGSGCTLSALITGYLALGEGVVNAIGKSKHVLWHMIKESYKPGRGMDVLDHRYNLIGEGELSLSFPTNMHFDVWIDLKTSVDRLLSFLSRKYVPEVGINFGYALPNANNIGEICAIDGRIMKTSNKPVRCGSLGFGVSKHVASIILAAMGSNPEIRSAMNIKYSEGNIDKLEESGLKIGCFDRKKEPKNTKSTMEWGTNQVIKQSGYVPDVIYDMGAAGKEPIIRLLGESPEKVVKKAFLLCKNQ